MSENFEYRSKAKVIEYIASKGGVIDKEIKKSTNFLVIENDGSSRYFNSNYGTKMKKGIRIRSSYFERKSVI